MEDAGPSVDNGDEEQEGQHGEFPGASLGLEMIVPFFFPLIPFIPFSHFSFFVSFSFFLFFFSFSLFLFFSFSLSFLLNSFVMPPSLGFFFLNRLISKHFGIPSPYLFVCM